MEKLTAIIALFALPTAYIIGLAVRMFYVYPKNIKLNEGADNKSLFLIISFTLLVITWALFAYAIGESILGNSINSSWSGLLGLFVLFPICVVLHLVYEAAYYFFIKRIN
jgi:hypothetical protein